MQTKTTYLKITVVTPNFNQGDFLEKTLRSVLDQGYPNLEYIIINGKSTDNSEEIIKKYNDRLYYWVSEKDDGMYHAINKGFSRATGDIMCWINSDDVSLLKTRVFKYFEFIGSKGSLLQNKLSFKGILKKLYFQLKFE